MNFSSRTLTRLSGETQLEPCRVAADSHHALPAEDGHLSCPAKHHLENRELGKLPPTARYGLIYSLEGTRTDRGCPWMTAADRCLGHAGGTAGEDEAGAGVAAMAISSAGG